MHMVYINAKMWTDVSLQMWLGSVRMNAKSHLCFLNTLCAQSWVSFAVETWESCSPWFLTKMKNPRKLSETSFIPSYLQHRAIIWPSLVLPCPYPCVSPSLTLHLRQLLRCWVRWGSHFSDCWGELCLLQPLSPLLTLTFRHTDCKIIGSSRQPMGPFGSLSLGCSEWI